MSYYLRWFYWSGVTNALIDAHDSGTPWVRHFLRRLLTAPFAAVVRLLSGRPADAAAVLADAAFAAGYLVQRVVRPVAPHLRRTAGAS